MSILETVRDAIGSKLSTAPAAKLAPQIAIKMEAAKSALASLAQEHGAAALDAMRDGGSDAKLVEWAAKKKVSEDELSNLQAAYAEALREDQKNEIASRARQREKEVRRVTQHLSAWHKEVVGLQAALENMARHFREADRLGETARQAALAAGLPWHEWARAGHFANMRKAVGVELWRVMTVAGYVERGGEFPGAPPRAFSQNEVASMMNLQPEFFIGNPGTAKNPGLSGANIREISDLAKSDRDRLVALISGKSLPDDETHLPPTVPVEAPPVDPNLFLGTVPTEPPQFGPLTPAPTLGDGETAPDAPNVAPLDPNKLDGRTMQAYHVSALGQMGDRGREFIEFLNAKYGTVTGSLGEVSRDRWSELQADYQHILAHGQLPALDGQAGVK